MRASLALCAAFAAGCVAATAAGADSFPDPRNFLYAPPTTPAPVAFALSRTLGDRMVLQRAPASAVVWGFAPPGTSVKTLFAGTSYTSTAGADTVWRQSLPPTPASATGVAITFSASTGATAALNDVLFGDVYVCGGQSNQVFTVTAANNSRAEIAAANDYPSIRLLTVGQKTSSNAPLNDLATLEQPWAVASNISIGGPGEFAYFSAVCWFFAKGIVDALGADAPPMGLVSSNCALAQQKRAATPPRPLTPLRPPFLRPSRGWHEDRIVDDAGRHCAVRRHRARQPVQRHDRPLHRRPHGSHGLYVVCVARRSRAACVHAAPLRAHLTPAPPACPRTHTRAQTKASLTSASPTRITTSAQSPR